MQIADQWLNAAKAELDGADPIEKLTSAKGNIRVKPWYDSSDIQSKQSFILRDEKSWLGARAWVNAPLVVVKDAATANKNALQQLTTGADGIVFELTEPVDLSILLENIQLAYCSVYFRGTFVSRDYADYLNKTGQTANDPTYKYHFRNDGVSPEISFANFFSGITPEHAARVADLSRGPRAPRGRGSASRSRIRVVSRAKMAVLAETGSAPYILGSRGAASTGAAAASSVGVPP